MTAGLIRDNGNVVEIAGFLIGDTDGYFERRCDPFVCMSMRVMRMIMIPVVTSLRSPRPMEITTKSYISFLDSKWLVTVPPTNYEIVDNIFFDGFFQTDEDVSEGLNSSPRKH